MPEVGEINGSVIKIAAQISEATPQQCRGCFRPDEISKHLASSVIAGRVTNIEVAKRSLRENLAANCLRGRVAVGGQNEQRECSYDLQQGMPA